MCDGERAVVLGTCRGVHSTIGARLQVRFAHGWTVRDGQAVRFEQITDTAAWRAAMP